MQYYFHQTHVEEAIYERTRDAQEERHVLLARQHDISAHIEELMQQARFFF